MQNIILVGLLSVLSSKQLLCKWLLSCNSNNNNFNNINNINNNNNPTALILILLFLSIPFFCFSFYMTTYHLYLLWINATTNENIKALYPIRNPFLFYRYKYSFKRFIFIFIIIINHIYIYIYIFIINYIILIYRLFSVLYTKTLL